MIFLGIDCGTQSTKTIALDWESRRILASAQQSYDFVAGLPPGAAQSVRASRSPVHGQVERCARADVARGEDGDPRPLVGSIDPAAGVALPRVAIQA